jgi:hypothetical protein
MNADRVARRSSRLDAVEERACLGRIEHRRLAGFNEVGGAAHRGGRVDRHDLADHQPIEEMPHGGEPLLGGRRRELVARQCLDSGGDMQRLHRGDRLHTDALAPRDEVGSGAAVSASGVRVADVGREEFEKAELGAGRPGDAQDRATAQRRHLDGGARESGDRNGMTVEPLV